LGLLCVLGDGYRIQSDDSWHHFVTQHWGPCEVLVMEITLGRDLELRDRTFFYQLTHYRMPLVNSQRANTREVGVGGVFPLPC